MTWNLSQRWLLSQMKQILPKYEYFKLNYWKIIAYTIFSSEKLYFRRPFWIWPIFPMLPKENFGKLFSPKLSTHHRVQIHWDTFVTNFVEPLHFIYWTISTSQWRCIQIALFDICGTKVYSHYHYPSYFNIQRYQIFNDFSFRLRFTTRLILQKLRHQLKNYKDINCVKVNLSEAFRWTQFRI
jgi:hypothetical protein